MIKPPKYMSAESTLRKHGVSTKWFLETWEKQDGRCAICRGTWAGSNGGWSVESKAGILCENCKHGLGRFKRDPYLLRAAADWLEEVLS